MPDFARCPHCGRRFRMRSATEPAMRCPHCDTPLEPEGRELEGEPRRQSRRPRRSSTGKILIGVVLGCGTLVLLCAGGIGTAIWWVTSATSYPEQTEEYAAARQNFRTQLLRQGPAPQSWEHEQPPPEAREVPYQSGELRLKAWVSVAPPDGARRPAVLFLHGGFAFGADDWEQTLPFRKAGFVAMTPMLRGENGLPGAYSMFYNEVDDVLAAADTLARLPYVDSSRIYVSGHSVGGTLTMLAAMTSNRFRAAASFSGSPDQVAWARFQEELVPFDPADKREYQMRSPLAFARSFQCPARLYYGSAEPLFASSTKKTAQLAQAAGRDVEAVSVPGDHLTSVEPAMRQAIAFFQQH